MSPKETFTQAADRRSGWRREGLPDPEKLATAGIRTKESLDWMAARTPDPPALEHHVPEEGVRANAHDAAMEEHRRRINRLRAAFRDRSLKARGDFGLARDYRIPDRQR